MNLNKTIIAGNITKDIELKQMSNGVGVVNFSVATNRFYEQDGEKKQETEFHSVVFFGKKAENIDKYLKKGSSVLIEGRLKTRSWEDSSGKTNYKTEIIGENVQFGQMSKSQNKKTSNEENEESEGNKDEIDVDAIDF